MGARALLFLTGTVKTGKGAQRQQRGELFYDPCTTMTATLELALRRIASASLRLENVTELANKGPRGGGDGAQGVCQHTHMRQAVQQQQQSPHKTMSIYRE